MRRHLTYANVMATIAVFLALGGGAAVAATTMLPRNSVGAAQLKRNAVTGRAIRNGTIKGADVSEASLGKVPSAARADRARNADEADSAANANHATKADSATSATSAATATTATSATTATTAARAANADAVGGLTAAQLKLRCPTGTRAQWGQCLELAAHGPATPLDALADCSSRGGRLPTYLELTWVSRQDDIVWAAGTGSNQYELTGDALDPDAPTTISLDRTGNVFPTSPATTFLFRCVLQQVNG